MKLFLEVLTAGIIAVPIILLTFEFASYMTYGGFLKSKDVIKALDFHLQKGATLNPYDKNIITIGDMPFISTTKSPFGYYYINDVGRVFVFSSAHRRISKIHDVLLSELSKPTIEEKLKIK